MQFLAIFATLPLAIAFGYLAFSSNEATWQYFTLAILMSAASILIIMVLHKGKHASGNISWIAYLCGFILANSGISRTYNEADAQQFVYDNLSIDMKGKYTKSEVGSVLEYISYLTLEKNTANKELFILLQEKYPSLTNADFEMIQQLESEYVSSVLQY